MLAAAAIYLTVDDGPGPAGAYAIIDGKAYPIDVSKTKIYNRELQRFGGKAAVLFDDFNRWFAGLWQGRSLAITIAWLGIAASLGVFLVAVRLPRDPE